MFSFSLALSSSHLSDFYFADESAFILYWGLLYESIGYFLFVITIAIAGRPLQSFLQSRGDRLRTVSRILAGLGALTVLSTLFSGDMPSNVWVQSFVVIGLMFVASSGQPRMQQAVTRFGWALLVWHTIVKMKFVYRADITMDMIYGLSQVLVYNVSYAVAYPISALGTLTGIEQANTIVAWVIQAQSEMYGLALVPLISLCSMGMVRWVGLKLSGPRDQDHGIEAPLPPRLRLGIMFVGVAAATVVLAGLLSEESPTIQALALFTMLVLPILVIDAWPWPSTMSLRWGLAGLMQAALGTVTICVVSDPKLKAWGLVALLTSLAVPIWKGLAWWVVSRTNQIRWLSGGGAILLCLFFPVLLIVPGVIGVFDLLFDVRSLRRRGGVVVARPSLARTMLPLLLLWIPFLAWAGFSIPFLHSLTGTPTKATFTKPTTVIAGVPQDPWETTEAICASRGQRPCRPDELVCDVDQCRAGLESFCRGISRDALPVHFYQDQRRTLLLFSTPCGWFPVWFEFETGGIPRQFILPRGMDVEALFQARSLAVFCCGNAESEEPGT